MNMLAERMQERSLAVAAITRGFATHRTGRNWEKLGTVKSSSPVRSQKMYLLFGSALPSIYLNRWGWL